MSITCYRWAKNGFLIQKQNHLIDEQKILLKEKNNIMNKSSGHTQRQLLNNHQSINLDPDFPFEGVFVFIVKPKKGDYLLYLNHIKREHKPDFHDDLKTREYDENTTVYVDNFSPNNKHSKMTLKEAFDKKHERVYIPKQ